MRKQLGYLSFFSLDSSRSFHSSQETRKKEYTVDKQDEQHLNLVAVSFLEDQKLRSVPIGNVLIGMMSLKIQSPSGI